MSHKRFFITGGAGFIGSHLCDYLLQAPGTERVSIYDNHSSGRADHYTHHQNDARFKVFDNDLLDVNRLNQAIRNHDVVIHLASNPDIAKAQTTPDIDFRQGTQLTNNVLEAMRVSNVKTLLYTSGSGVYGDIGAIEAAEDYSPMRPNSTYGASKLASEAMICAYSQMFGMRALCFRLGNAVGPRQTHGVGYDFLHKLTTNPNELHILGNGQQSKSYIHIDDIINAMMTAVKKSAQSFDVFNVATKDYITVQQIADIACSVLATDNTRYIYSGGNKGWLGDVPIVRLNTQKIRQLGWSNAKTSSQAIYHSISQMATNLRTTADKMN